MHTPTAEEIRTARLAAGLTGQQLSKLLGLSGASRISEYEHGKRTMSAQLWELMRLKLQQRNDNTQGETDHGNGHD